jgi:polyhydroxybutyrate depolymerase
MPLGMLLHTMRRAVPLALLVGLAGCKTQAPAAQVDASPPSPAVATSSSRRRPPSAPRDFAFYVPYRLEATKPAPLVVFFHGYGSSGVPHARAWGLEALADAKGFVLARPDGTIDARGSRFWNATDACCDFGHTDVDDVGFVGSLIDAAVARYNVDPKRVYVVGHSNGGFFAYRLACDLAPRIAAAVSVAGATWADRSRCHPASPVSIAQAHGTKDDIIRLGGGTVFDLPVPPYPSVEATVAAWAAYDGCAGAIERTPKRLDLVPGLAGAETTVSAYGGCPAGVAVELWSIDGGDHAPSFARAWSEALYAFFAAHSKP